MSAPPRRDTFIALRARRQALRIASSVAFSRLSAKVLGTANSFQTAPPQVAMKG